jgi:hypothetical protein
MSNTTKGFMPLFPWMDPSAFDWSAKKTDCKDNWKKFKSDMDKYYDQMKEMQEAAIDNAKKQWGKFFDQVMEMEEIFIESLPDEVPAMPGVPEALKPAQSPRAVMKKVKEFQKAANDHAVKQTDSVVDFCKKGQKEIKKAVTEAVKNVEENVEKAEKKAEPKAEEAKPAEEAAKE